MKPGEDDDDIYDDDLPGNYPASEDIFNQGLIEEDIDPENTERIKSRNPDPEAWNEKSFPYDMVGDDLDIPGAELDDEDELIGREDEENNYYSLGGDNHEDLEEHQETE
ncbi:hypothetical protein [Dyadobacter helix]|nr:hypothetical protein [Dyadobacter sp. CECT 9275]